MTATEPQAIDAGLLSDPPAPRAPGVWRWLTGDERWTRSTVASWIVLVAVAVFALQGIVRSDFREKPVAGDQTSFLLQALSLSGPGHDLSYDAGDMDRWREAGWVPSPTSLFFQRNASRWAFGKPYAYSLHLAAFIAVFAIPVGVALANATLVLLLVALVVAILRVRFRGPVVPVAAIALVFSSYAYLYGYVLHQELFLAVVTAGVGYLAIRAWSATSWGWAAGAVALMAATIPEKPQFVALYLPIAIGLVWRRPGLLRKLVLVALAGVVFIGATAPYRHYSGGQAWNAYQGDRFFTNGPTPFDRPALSESARQCPPVCRVKGEVSLTSFDGVRTRVEQGRGQFASVFYYFFGRYTGLLVFIPFACLVLLVVPLLYRKRLDSLAWTLLGAIVAYILLNIAVYPTNYYGGGQSLGDRYFLQVAPVAIAFLVAARVAARTTMILSVVGIVIGVAFLWPHHVDPSNAYIRIDVTSPLQRLLPVERNQDGLPFFRCPIYGDCSSTAQVIEGFG